MRVPEELRERTKRLASRVVRFYTALPRQRKEVEVLGHQLLRSGTSVAAHVREASRARSSAEFCSRIEGALQEADESQLWCELLRDDCAVEVPDLDHLLAELEQLIAIFVTIVHRTKTADR